MKAENTVLKLELKKLRDENKEYKAELQNAERLIKENCVQKKVERHDLDCDKKVLGANVCKQLNKLGASQKSDSMFVSKIMRRLYSDKMDELRTARACVQQFVTPEDKYQ